MMRLSSHTARALADERVRELTRHRPGERPDDGLPARRRRIGNSGACPTDAGAAPRSAPPRGLVLAVRHLRRRLDPGRG